MTCDLGIIANTTLAVAMQLSSIHILFLHSLLFDSVITSYGPSRVLLWTLSRQSVG